VVVWGWGGGVGGWVWGRVVGGGCCVRGGGWRGGGGSGGGGGGGGVLVSGGVLEAGLVGVGGEGVAWGVCGGVRCGWWGWLGWWVWGGVEEGEGKRLRAAAGGRLGVGWAGVCNQAKLDAENNYTDGEPRGSSWIKGWNIKKGSGKSKKIGNNKIGGKRRGVLEEGSPWGGRLMGTK